MNETEMKRIMDGMDDEYEWIITDNIYGRIGYYVGATDKSGRVIGVSVFVVRHEAEDIEYKDGAIEVELTPHQLKALRDKINETLEMNGCNHDIILSFSRGE